MANREVTREAAGDLEAVDTLLELVRVKGVKLWSENGQLRYRAPKGSITPEEIERLRASKDRLVGALAAEPAVSGPSPMLEIGPRPECIPLAFSQLAHWNLYRLKERDAVRQIVSATRIKGPLQVDVLLRSFAAMVRRHEALRTRIVVREGTPVQEVLEEGVCELRVESLRTLAGHSQDEEVARRIEQGVLEPINASVGPLFAGRLLRLNEDHHVLILVMEHMISDAFSMGILLRDLFDAYARGVRGEPMQLPTVPVQFADYAIWQRKRWPAWQERHQIWWAQYLKGCRRVRFPADLAIGEGQAGWETVPVRISKDCRTELREWCRLNRTTMVMAVFTAYVATVMRWCKVQEIVLPFQTNGRDVPGLEGSIGYFACPLYIRFRLSEDDTFADFLSHVTAEYCAARDRADSSWFEAQVPRPEFTRNTCFNWVPLGPTFSVQGLAGTGHALEFSALPTGHPMLGALQRDTEPLIVLFDEEDGINGDVYFPRDRFSREMMERFAGTFLGFVRALLRRTDAPVKSISLLD